MLKVSSVATFTVPLTVRSDVSRVVAPVVAGSIVKLFKVAPPPTIVPFVPVMVTVVEPAVTEAGKVRLFFMEISEAKVGVPVRVKL